ncbi:MAG: nitronate monooxygenase [Acidaminococcales bacterium]|jgi:enoyl-[acyl-carrier protein] reductase II|nr:nitronate monooxygenase [Acidaminococcales bacterium]
MENRFTKLLGIKYPIIQGGMAWSSDAGLAAAVSNAGGAGIIGTGGRTVEWTVEQIRKAKSLTDKPFGVNVVLLAPNVGEIIDAVCAEKVAFVTLGAGNPVPHFEKFKKAGIKIIPVIPNVKLAQRVEEKGADAFVIEGMEGGGHIGSLTTMALLSNVPPKVKIPIIAAGGIVDGRGMAAALLMGASGIQMGSRFLLTEECPVHPAFKRRVIEAVDTDSVVTGYSRNSGVRCLKNDFTARFLAKEISGAPQEELNRLATGTNRLASVEGDINNGAVQVGQSLYPLDSIKTCKQVIEDIIAEAERTLAEAGKIKLSLE